MEQYREINGEYSMVDEENPASPPATVNEAPVPAGTQSDHGDSKPPCPAPSHSVPPDPASSTASPLSSDTPDHPQPAAPTSNGSSTAGTTADKVDNVAQPTCTTGDVPALDKPALDKPALDKPARAIPDLEKTSTPEEQAEPVAMEVDLDRKDVPTADNKDGGELDCCISGCQLCQTMCVLM